MRAVKLNNELARPIGIVDGTSVGGTRRPRVGQHSSPCLVTRGDGTQYVIAAKRVTRAIARRQVAEVIAKEPVYRITAADLRPIMDSNH